MSLRERGDLQFASEEEEYPSGKEEVYSSLRGRGVSPQRKRRFKIPSEEEENSYNVPSEEEGHYDSLGGGGVTLRGRGI